MTETERKNGSLVAEMGGLAQWALWRADDTAAVGPG
jgi:hypothetical protein